ncbi:MAG: deoxyguanosinetriphosphate triphosphohydrolase, partial [Mycobacteriales bacterium]
MRAEERYVVESPDLSGPLRDTAAPSPRSAYARDRARVLHSAALRRLAAKTQVEAAGEEDFPRTRLTHSLEVAQIGRELGASLGCDPDIVDAAGLAHDLGHPPFGHNGENLLHELAVPCGGFEGNAQTLRILTRLEPKVLRNDGSSAGLNLTRATLDAVTKYPWPATPSRGRKFGVYADDAPVFAWLRRGAPGERRCIEAQVMEWADDVAYSVHDVEDGVHAGHIRLGRLDDPQERQALCDGVSATQPLGSEPLEDLAELQAALDDLMALPALRSLASYDSSHSSHAAMKQATSALVGRLVSGVAFATRRRFGGGLSRYRADLVIPRVHRMECALLKGMATRYVMQRPQAQARCRAQHELLTELVERVTAQAPESLDAVFRPWWLEARDDAAAMRVIID